MSKEQEIEARLNELIAERDELMEMAKGYDGPMPGIVELLERLDGEIENLRGDL